MAEQAMDARSIAPFLRRRWRTIAAMGLVGAALGVVYVSQVPPQLSSATLILFPAASGNPGAGQEPVTDTQVHIVTSTPVLARAGKSLAPRLSVSAVQNRVSVAAKTANLIEIQGFSTDARTAQKLSQAVADAYITTLKDNLASLSGVPPQLTSRAAALNKQLNDLRAQIAATTERLQTEKATSSGGIRDAELLSELVNDQTDLLVRLDKVREAVDAATNGSIEVPDIIQPAAPATGPSKAQRLVTWAGIGALLLAAITALGLVLRGRRDPRVRSRDDLADAVGSSLLAAVRGRPQRSIAGWLALFQTYEAPSEEAWAFRQLLRALAPPSDSWDPARVGGKPGRVEHPRSLSIMALSGDLRAVAVGPQLAVFAASLGIGTRFVMATRDDSVAALCAACASDRGGELRQGLMLATGGTEEKAPSQKIQSRESRPQTSLSEHADSGAADLTIYFTVANRREPSLDGVPATAATMLAISPGAATRDELAKLAVAVDDAGRRIDGVVVADRDPSDRTTGRHTLDERAAQAPLPIRMTGPSQVTNWPRRGSKAQ